MIILVSNKLSQQFADVGTARYETSVLNLNGFIVKTYGLQGLMAFHNQYFL